MKKIIYISIVLCTILSSCHGDLKIQQESEFSSLSMWTSESDAVSAINGVYTQFRATMATSLPVYGDYRSGLYGGGMMTLKDYDRMAENVIVKDMEGTDWSALYTTINDCNLVLKYTPTIKFSQEATKNMVLANAKFIRAYCYFIIARVWGDAPCLTSGFESDKQDDLYPTRTAASKLFELVESDLTEAESLIPSTEISKYFASKASVNMLIADYYLWKAKVLNGGESALKSAQTAINKVLGNNNYLLESQFSKVFGVENEKSQEIIFSIKYERNEYTGGYPSYYLAPEQYVEDKSLVNNPVPIGSHQQYVSITDKYEEFLNSSTNDSRNTTSFGICMDGTTRWRWINKFKGEWINETRFFSSDIIIYRYAEAILMKAEVENALSNSVEAVAQLNKIAKRAYGIDNKYSTSLSKTDIDNTIIDETLKEFVGEAKSWWTLIRFNQEFTRIASLKGKENVKNILLWPVSSSCLNTNPNIDQTENY